MLFVSWRDFFFMNEFGPSPFFIKTSLVVETENILSANEIYKYLTEKW